MPEVSFQVVGVEPEVRGLTPLLNFKVQISSAPEEELVQALLLSAQIQLQSAQRKYTASEKERLFELFGPPEAWGQTLRNRLWAHANTTVGAFRRTTETTLPVACTYDLNIAATKYLYALEGDEVSLLFLFSGSVFYTAPDGRLQVSPISWSQESVYRMPAQVWRGLMEQNYPNTAWLTLHRDVFDRLYAFKRRFGATSWDETIEHLLAGANTLHATRNTELEVSA